MHYSWIVFTSFVVWGKTWLATKDGHVAINRGYWYLSLTVVSDVQLQPSASLVNRKDSVEGYNMGLLKYKSKYCRKV